MTPNPPPSAPQPRRWIRLQPVECRHVAVSTELIQAAAASVPPGGRALILGPGKCRELPLAALCEQFSSITLVDRQSGGAAAAVAPLRSRTPCAWEIRSDDLIGISASFLAEVDARLAASPDAERAVRSLTELTKTSTPTPYVDAAGPYDLVIASCVLSQLVNSLTQGAVARFVERFPQDAPRPGAPNEWTQAMFELSARGEAAFLQSLAELVRPGGRVYLSETLQACFVRLHPQGGWATEGTLRLTRRPHLADYLDGRFAIERQETWPWVGIAPGPQRVGRLFQVEGAVLRPL